jgi:hypothetical protein
MSPLKGFLKQFYARMLLTLATRASVVAFIRVRRKVNKKSSDIALRDRETGREHVACVEPPVDQLVLVGEVEQTLQFRKCTATALVDRRVLVRVGVTCRPQVA